MTTNTDDYYAGKGCECDGNAEIECGCGVDWTDPRIYKLQQELSSAVKLLSQFNTLRIKEDRSLSEDQWLEYCRLYREYSNLVG